MSQPSGTATILFGTNLGDIMVGSSGEDVLYGLLGADALFGNAGRDFLFGDEGDDTLQGGAGNDYLMGGAGADVLDGGDGIDEVNYHSSESAVTIDLSSQTAGGDQADGDTLISIESARGSHFDDLLIGDDGDNFLCGLGGDDALYGGGGNDILRGAEDGDFLDGGAGIDTATYWSSNAGIIVNLGTGMGRGGHAKGDTLTSIEIVKGSAYSDKIASADSGSTLYGYEGDDFLYGRRGADMLVGGAGDDYLSGRGGHDMLFGDDGDDVIEGGGGSDVITAGRGNDLIEGGAGADQFKFRAGDGMDRITDFEAGIDTIVFSDSQTQWNDLETVQQGDDVAILYGDGDLLLVDNATLAEVWSAFDFY